MDYKENRWSTNPSSIGESFLCVGRGVKMVKQDKYPVMNHFWGRIYVIIFLGKNLFIFLEDHLALFLPNSPYIPFLIESDDIFMSIFSHVFFPTSVRNRTKNASTTLFTDPPQKKKKKGDFLFSFSDFFFSSSSAGNRWCSSVYITQCIISHKKGGPDIKCYFYRREKPAAAVGGVEMDNTVCCVLCCISPPRPFFLFFYFLRFSPNSFFSQVRIERLFWNFPIEKKIRFFLSLSFINRLEKFLWEPWNRLRWFIGTRKADNCFIRQ